MRWNPEDYAQNSDAQLKWARELRANLDLQGTEAVLDVGCGDGKITADFAKVLPQGRILGTDRSVEMVEYAARHYRANNLAFAPIDARALTFDQEFDLVFSKVLAEVTARPAWRQYFGDFRNPYFFHGDDQYAQWLATVGLQADRLQLVAKDMTHLGAKGLAGWIRTTWMPFTHCIPTKARDLFIDDFLSRYLELVPMDDRGYTHVAMVRLEVSAHKL